MTTSTVKATERSGHYEIFRNGIFVEKVYATPYIVHAKNLTSDERIAVQLKAAADYKRNC